MTIQESEKHIKNAAIAAVISASVILFLSLLPLIGVSLGGYEIWNLLDVVLIAGMAYGISRKSRTCAVIMLTYFVVSRILSISESGIGSDLIIAGVFAYYYFQGTRGAFVWHSLRKRA